MKRWSILSGIAVILLSLFVQPACAQGSDSRQAGGGFWVVESNLATPHIVTVRFYEEGNRLIYEEHLTGVRMNVSKRRTQRRLDQQLRDVLTLAKARENGAADVSDSARAAGISWGKER